MEQEGLLCGTFRKGLAKCLAQGETPAILNSNLCVCARLSVCMRVRMYVFVYNLYIFKNTICLSKKFFKERIETYS